MEEGGYSGEPHFFSKVRFPQTPSWKNIRVANE